MSLWSDPNANPSRRVRRMDLALLAAALITTGVATVLFLWAYQQQSDDEEADNATVTPSITASATLTLSPTLTLTFTPTSTATLTPTRVASNTPTPTATFTDTPTPTDTNTPTATPTNTATHTPTFTNTPYPLPEVNPITLAETYAGEPIEITGSALEGDIITLLDNGERIFEVPVFADGAWEIQLEDGLAAGSHRLELFATSPDEVHSAIVPLGFVVNDAPTATPTNTATSTPTLTPTFTRTSRPTRTPTEVSEVIMITPEVEQGVTVTTEVSQLVVTEDTLTPTQTTISTSTSTSTTTPTETATPTHTATSTPNIELLPVTATFTPTFKPTDTATVTNTPLPTDTPTLTPTVEVPTVTDTPIEIAQVVAPRFDTPDNPYSPFVPIRITGSAAPNVTVVLTANGEEIGRTLSDGTSGTWSILWTDTYSASIEAVAVDQDGNTSPPAQASIVIDLAAPRINTPNTGYTMQPGSLTFSGMASASAPLVLLQDDGELAQIFANPDGTWSTSIAIGELGQYHFRVIVRSDTGEELITSNVVRVTVADSIAPETGGILASEDDAVNRSYIALIAVLFTVGGFTLLFVGRIFYLRATKP